MISVFHAGKHRNFASLDFRKQRSQNTLIAMARRDCSIGHMNRVTVPESPFEIIPPHKQCTDNRFVLIEKNRRQPRSAACHEFGQYVFLVRLALEIEWNTRPSSSTETC